jgi:hypothetical protein
VDGTTVTIVVATPSEFVVTTDDRTEVTELVVRVDRVELVLGAMVAWDSADPSEAELADGVGSLAVVTGATTAGVVGVDSFGSSLVVTGATVLAGVDVVFTVSVVATGAVVAALVVGSSVTVWRLANSDETALLGCNAEDFSACGRVMAAYSVTPMRTIEIKKTRRRVGMRSTVGV